MRLFVALDIPAPIRDQIARWQKEALSDPALRPMRPESLHVTLCFLSYQPEKAIPRIAERIASVGARPVELHFDPEPSPRPKGRPRLYAIGGRSESAAALQAELAGDARGRGLLQAREARLLAARDRCPGALRAPAARTRGAPGQGPAAAGEAAAGTAAGGADRALRSRPDRSLPFRSQASRG